MFHLHVSETICVQRLWFITDLTETCVSFHYTQNTGRLRLVMRHLYKPTQYSVTPDDGLSEIENTTTRDFLNIPETYISKGLSYSEVIEYITKHLESIETQYETMYSDATMYECDILWVYLKNSMVCLSFIYNEDKNCSLVYSHKIIDTTTPSHQLIKNTERDVADQFDRNDVTIYKINAGETYNEVLTTVLEYIEDNAPIQTKVSRFHRIKSINRSLRSFHGNKFYKFDKVTGTLQYMKYTSGTPSEEIFNRNATEMIVPVRTSRGELDKIIKEL